MFPVSVKEKEKSLGNTLSLMPTAHNKRISAGRCHRRRLIRTRHSRVSLSCPHTMLMSSRTGVAFVLFIR